MTNLLRFTLRAALSLALLPAGFLRAELPEGTALREALLKEADGCSKAEWRPMLRYLAGLHGKSVFPAVGHLPFPYESIGPGYQGGRVFGHIDLAHERLDTVRAAPAHVRAQTLNELAGQQPDGFLPGVVTFDPAGKPYWKPGKGFPPFWVEAAEAYYALTKDKATLGLFLAGLKKQIGWFERERAAPGGGFYYLDAQQETWESGMDQGIRWDARPSAVSACVDATAHVAIMYERAAGWSHALGQPEAPWAEKARALRSFVQTELWDAESGFFYDRWVVREPAKRQLAFEGMWPVVAGAATPEQARRVIAHLLNPREFFTPHPIATVAASEPKFELRMWRGPAWNCMTYWAARGCLRYGERAAAEKLLAAALDATAADFAKTGTLWEFYHPQLGEAQALYRKAKGRHIPCDDYLGHNPLFAMAALWAEAKRK